MDIGSIFLILALLVLVGLFIGRPLFERKAISVSEEEHELSSLLAERDRLLNALQELDFDYSLGKIPEDDYPAQRALLVQKGADILRQLDTYQPEEVDADARIETAIAARRVASTGSTGPTPLAPPLTSAGEIDLALDASNKAAVVTLLGEEDDDIETRIATRRRNRQDKSAGFCPQCGNPIQKSDRFCPKCGTGLDED